VDKIEAVTEEALVEYIENFIWDSHWEPLPEEMDSMLYTIQKYIRRYGEL